MRLAFVTFNSDPWGGSEVLWTATAKYALQQGHDVLVSMYDFADLPAQILELKELGAEFYFRRAFYPVAKDRIRKKIKNKFAKQGAKSTYHDYLNKFAPDKILFSLGAGDEIAKDDADMMVFVKQTNVPFSIFCHNVSFVPDTDERINNNFRYIFAKAQQVFFTSKHQCHLYEHQICAQIDKAKILNHPLNLNLDQKIEFFESEVCQMAVVGTLSITRKGQDVAIQALSSNKWKDRSFQLNIYGVGRDRAYLEELVKYYGLTDKVVFHDYVNSIDEIWSKNQILLIPSRQDTGPIVLFEAMYCAKPIVATKMGAVPEYVHEDENGFLCSVGSSEGFEAAVEKAWQNKGKWKQMGQKSLAIIKEKYDFEPEKTLLNYLEAQA